MNRDLSTLVEVVPPILEQRVARTRTKLADQWSRTHRILTSLYGIDTCLVFYAKATNCGEVITRSILVPLYIDTILATGNQKSTAERLYSHGETVMLTKTTIALVAALILAPASVALANDNAANEGEVGGIKIGPLGQVFGTPEPSRAFGQALPYRHVRPAHKHATR